MDPQEINQLINKYLAGTATEAEQDILLNWYRSQDPEDVEWHSGHPHELEELRERVLANLHAHVESKRKKVWVMNSHWKRIAVAAVLLLAFSLVIYQKTGQHATVEDAVISKTETVTAIPPGGSHAVLTTANGPAIQLDTLKNGVVAANGYVSFNKVEDGQLSYEEVAVDKDAEVVWNTLSTPRGGQYTVTLSDGTRVWLNAASSLHFPTAFSANERNVTITGEAYFEVAKNKDKPFRVMVNGMQVEVLGTHFNVNGYENESMITTTLLEGKVRVKPVSGEAVSLKQGQQARLNRSGGLKVLDNINTQEAVAWKEGMFVFNNTEASSIMRQLERWYNVDVDINRLPEKRFNGMISRSVNLSEVLKMMEVTSNIRFKVEGKKITVN